MYIHEKGHSWPGQEFRLHVMYCTTLHEDGMEPIENLCDGVETVNELCFFGDKLKTSGG